MMPKVETLSPDWVVAKLEGVVGEVGKRIRGLFKTQIIALALMTVSISIALYLTFSAEGRRSWLLWRMMWNVIPFACGTVLICSFLSPRTLASFPGFRPLLMLGLTILSLCRRPSFSRWSSAAFGLSFIALVVFWAIYATRGLPQRIRNAIYTLLMAVVYFEGTLLLIFMESLGIKLEAGSGLFMHPFMVLFCLAPLFAVEVVGPKLSFSQLISHAFSPLQMVNPYPLMPETIKLPAPRTTKGDLLAHVYLNLFGGFVAGVIAYFLFPYTRFAVEQWYEYLWRGWLVYLFYFFTWLGILRITYAAGRSLGYNLQNPSHYSFFAVNPIDRWRRWNLPFYQWSLAMIYLPVARTLRSPVVGVFAVFLVLFMAHNVYAWNIAIFGTKKVPMLSWLRLDAQFYFLHFLVVVIAYPIRAWWPASQSKWGWCGNLATHLSMAITHSVLRL